MTNDDEKRRRRALVRKWKDENLHRAVAAMPISKHDLAELLEFVEERSDEGCDSTLRHTRSFMRTRRLPEDLIVAWLGEYGGFCDCEVAGNVGSEWGDWLEKP
jgi:uncharacterized protein DUF2695